ncbi:DMT family transporter [Prevotella lacticifex]|uniref:Membrane protein n=1 Tax=Prevotella lacticifex TaxID=2854755 RepID=A0A9R1CBZ2_9BACT|nr:DMT family transporter [Prevotella lacticifex]GJG36550.1 membrane protein [Prevotella lacticifex]GJG38409.1 membrane protein [Prevotella lacticifex]GJG42908.1 membrane protein [Prevotella lacticifex]GJG44766.1 membrane protein [Prevotella lacticifex]GJG49259.1 membrane protein [Prevotella lacticifex]
MKDSNAPLRAHLSMFIAEAIWGFMAPIGKAAMNSGFDGISVVSFRVAGAALLFWLASFIGPREHIPGRDIVKLAGAAVLGIVFNQCLFNIGLSITSPVNASIVTTSMPIFAMVLSFFILKEPITWKKALGVAIGCCGALILIFSSASAGNAKVGDIRGDLMCLGAQFSFALYLALFNPLIRKYNVFTVNKWMFTWASLFVLPFTTVHVSQLSWASFTAATWLEVVYMVVLGTFVSYLLSVVAQSVLRPTVVSVYNYVQPIVSVVVSVAVGMSVFTLPQGVAVVLVFTGVWLVIKSKSKRDEELRAKR